jgi:hypothetical protein
MAGKGLWEIPYQGIRELKRATTLRIPLKPLLAIPHVGSSAIFSLIKFDKHSVKVHCHFMELLN